MYYPTLKQGELVGMRDLHPHLVQSGKGEPFLPIILPSCPALGPLLVMCILHSPSGWLFQEKYSNTKIESICLIFS